MKTNNTQAGSQTIDTGPLRAMLRRIAETLVGIDMAEAPERATKLTIQMINLTKTIRETESYNRGITAPLKNHGGGATLEERLEGYAPSPSELQALRAELKKHLKILGPRLYEDDIE